jgi:hypothetical protein
MKKSQSYVLANSSRQTARKYSNADKENDTRVSNKNKKLDFALTYRQNKFSIAEDYNMTKKRAVTTKPTRKSSIETNADSISSVSTKNIAKVTKKQKSYLASFKNRKFSELKIFFNTTQKKRIMIRTNKKIYRDSIKFMNKNKPHIFPLYHDRDILNIYFKAELIPQELDNDVETDEEQLIDAKRFLIDSLRDGIKEFRKM